MKLIPVGKHHFAKVDDADFELASQHTWYYHTKGKHEYARTFKQKNRIRKYNCLHNLILGLKWVDHIDGDGLNCQRYNLRPCTPLENARNSRRRSDNTSGFKGVLKAWGSRWKAFIYLDGQYNHLGCFDTAKSAHAAYIEAARKLFGEFACGG
jgi:hypothetical protein